MSSVTAPCYFEIYLIVGGDENAGRWLETDPTSLCGAFSDAAVMPYVLKSHTLDYYEVFSGVI
jgi:hypothetical protein